MYSPVRSFDPFTSFHEGFRSAVLAKQQIYTGSESLFGTRVSCVPDSSSSFVYVFLVMVWTAFVLCKQYWQKNLF